MYKYKVTVRVYSMSCRNCFTEPKMQSHVKITASIPHYVDKAI